MKKMVRERVLRMVRRRVMLRKERIALIILALLMLTKENFSYVGPRHEDLTLNIKIVGVNTSDQDGVGGIICPNELEVEIIYRVNYNTTSPSPLTVLTAGWHRVCLSEIPNIPCGPANGGLNSANFRYVDWWAAVPIPLSQSANSIDIMIRMAEDDDSTQCITGGDDIQEISPSADANTDRNRTLVLKYDVINKTWSGDVTTPYAVGNGLIAARAKIWFWIQSDDDNEAVGGYSSTNPTPADNEVLVADFADIESIPAVLYGVQDSEVAQWRVFPYSIFSAPLMQRNFPDSMWQFIANSPGSSAAGRTDYTIVPSMHLRDTTGRLGGLTGCYKSDASVTRTGYDTMTCNMTRFDPRIDFDWVGGSAGNGFTDSDTFRVRWTGEILTTNLSGTYYFCLGADDGGRIRIRVNNSWTTICNDTTDSAYGYNCCGSISLQANTFYPIEVGFYENTGNARVALVWAVPSVMAGNDYYSFQYSRIFVRPGGSAGGTITNLPYDYDLFLVDPFGRVVARSTLGGTSDETVSYGVGNNFGYYTFIVGNWDSRAGWIRFTNISADSGFPDARQGRNLVYEKDGYGYLIATADGGGFGAPAGGVSYQCISGFSSCTTTRLDNQDFYTFWVHQGERINISVGPNASMDVSVDLIDPGGSVVASSNTGGAGVWEKISFVATQTGLWYMRVNLVSGFGNYYYGYAINPYLLSSPNSKIIEFSLCDYRPDEYNCWVRGGRTLTITQRAYDSYSTPAYQHILFNGWPGSSCSASGTLLTAEYNLESGWTCTYPIGSSSVNGLIINSGTPQTPTSGGLFACYRNKAAGARWEFFGNCDADGVVSSISFNWGTGSPAPGINTDYFNVEFIGEFQTPPTTGTYRFCINSDDGGFIWVNKVPVVEDKSLHAAGFWRCGNIFLEGGTWYPIRVGVFESTGNASVEVRVLPPGGQEFILSNSSFPLRYGGIRGNISTMLWGVTSGTIDADFPIITAIRDEVCALDPLWQNWQTCGITDFPTGYTLRVDVTPPTPFISWSYCPHYWYNGSYLSGNDCWVSSLYDFRERKFSLDILSQDTRSTPKFQGLIFDVDAVSPYDSDHFVNVNTTYNSTTSIVHVSEAYFELLTATCTTLAGCQGSDAQISWTGQVSTSAVDVDYTVGVSHYDEVMNFGITMTTLRLRLDGSQPTYIGFGVSGCDYMASATECWVKSGTTFQFALTYSDTRSGPLQNYLAFTDLSCTPNSCGCSWGSLCSSGNEIKSSIYSASYGTYPPETFFDHMWNDSYINISGASCMDGWGQCGGIPDTSRYLWTITVGTLEKDYKVFGYLYDKAWNGQGYNDTGIRVRIDATLPTYTVSATTSPSGGGYTFGSWTREDVRVQITASDTRSGVDRIIYCVDSSDTCTPSVVVSGSSLTYDFICPSGSVCVNYIRFQVRDRVGNITAVDSRQIRIDKENPTSSISPNGVTWQNVDAGFTISSGDGVGSGVLRTCYSIIDDGSLCPSQNSSCTGWSQGNAGTVSCPSSSVCMKRVCYYSVDNVLNVESLKESNVFYLDKVSPTYTISATTSPSGSPYYCGSATSEDVRVQITASDTGGGFSTQSGVWKIRWCIDTTNSCTPSNDYVGSTTYFDIVSDGTYYIRFQVFDYAGNVTSVGVCEVGIQRVLRPVAKIFGIGSGHHSCAIKTDGSLWCWGENDEGELGNGNYGAGLSENAAIPIMSSGVSKVVSGFSHTCALKSDGSLLCWGGNAYGQVGKNPAFEPKVPSPYQVMTGVSDVFTGWYHTLALKTDNTLWCFGRNEYYQLGNGSNISTHIPQQVLSNVLKASGGALVTCAVLTDGSLSCWGTNTYGQFGDGSTTTKQYTTPTPITTISSLKDICLGEKHTCAVKTDGSLWCWGVNDEGQLGNGTYSSSLTPQQIFASGVSKVSCGARHTCALLNTGEVRCWGLNDKGQLGDGTTTTKNTPTTIFASGISDVSSANRHTCFLVGDKMQCTGENSLGQLGDRTYTMRNTPVDVKVKPGLLAPPFFSIGSDDNYIGSDDKRDYKVGCSIYQYIPLLLFSLLLLIKRRK